MPKMMIPSFNGRCYYTDLEAELRVLLSSRSKSGNTKKERIKQILRTCRVARAEKTHKGKLMLLWAE